MERYSDGIGLKQLAAITVFVLALGIATFMILLNTLFASSEPNRLDEVLDRYWPSESASPGLGVGGADIFPRLTGVTLAVTGASATVTVPLSTEITLGVSGASATIAVNVLDVPSGDLGAYQFKIFFDDSVLEATNALGGDSPFTGVTAFNVTTSATGGAVTWNSFQGGSVSVPASITVANVVFVGIGSVGECSAIDLTVEELVDNSAVAIDNTHQDGEICLAAAAAVAETDLVTAQDTDDVALPTGVKSTIDLIKGATTGDPLPGKLLATRPI